MPHGDMALRCGLNTWSVHAVLEHAACTPRPVYHACKPGSVHATCTLAALYTWPVHSALVHVACRQSVKFIYTRSVYRQHCRRVQAGVFAELGSTKHFTKRHHTQYGRRGCTVSSWCVRRSRQYKLHPIKRQGSGRRLVNIASCQLTGCKNRKVVKI